MNCKNCDAAITGKFCAACGQKADTHRITLNHVFHDVVHGITHADKGFLVLAAKLFTRPGIIARDYVEGKRKRYFNPISFLVLTMAISAYASYKSGYFEAMIPKRPANAPVVKELTMNQKVMRETGRIVVNEGKYLGLGLITPLIALLSWGLFRKGKFNFAENLVLAAFVFGLANVVRIVIFIPLHLALPGRTSWVDLGFQVVFLIYLIVAFQQFFKEHIALTILKSIVLLGLFIYLFWQILKGFAYLKVVMAESL